MFGGEQKICSFNSAIRSIYYLLVIIFFLSGCATKPEVITKADEQEILRNRIQEYWQFKINGNAEKAYQVETPEFRERVSLPEYLNQFKRVKYLDADILKIETDGEKGKSSVKLGYMMLLKHLTGKKLTKTEEEAWVKIKDIWYHIP